MKVPKLVDLTGQRFGRLTVIERSGKQCGHATWLCKCDCGNEVVVASNNLKKDTFSCGCYQREQSRKSNTTHGIARSKIHFIWIAMKQRCFNPNNKGFCNYGGRGITVCEEWKNDFQAFYDYVSQLPHFGEEGYSLDRINNDGNYEPNNVKWSTKTEQNVNRRKKRNGIEN